MTIFEHSFTLIGLVLGLALAQVLSGLVSATRTHSAKTLGALTPMLAVFFILDVTTFWAILWNERTSLTSMSPTLGMGILLCSLYYFAGALVFPEAGEVWPDLDSYYMRHRRLVLALMLTCYVVVVTLLSIRAGKYWDDSAGTFYMLVLAGLVAAPAWKPAHIIGLATLIVVDIYVFFA